MKSEPELQAESTPQPQEAPAQVTDPLEQVVALLSGDEPQAEQPVAEQDQPETADVEQEQQETAEAEPAKLDYSMEVPLASGEKVTLGELKDAYQNQAKVLLEVQERDAKFMRERDEVLRLAVMFEDVSPQIKHARAQQFDQIVRMESEHVLSVLPSWRTDAARAKDEQAIVELANEYGVGREVETELRAVTNHRFVKMLHDFAKLRSQVKAAGSIRAQKAAEPAAKAKPIPTASAATAAILAKAKRGDVSAQLAAVNQLIKG